MDTLDLRAAAFNRPGGVAAAEENPPTIASEAKTTRRVRRIDDTSTSFHEGEPIH